MTTGARLRAARERLGLTQTEAAARAGVSQEQWSRYETGTRDPGMRLFEICLALGVDPNAVDERFKSTKGE